MSAHYVSTLVETSEGQEREGAVVRLVLRAWLSGVDGRAGTWMSRLSLEEPKQNEPLNEQERYE